MDNSIDTLSAPMKYDTATRTYSLYSEDFSLIGDQTFTLEAHLTDWPVIATLVKAETSIITIGNPCGDPDSVVSPL